MIFNLNYNDPTITRKINELVGKPYSLRERILKGGTGTSKLLVKEMSNELVAKFGLNHDLKYVSIELRSKGIIVYIKSKINDYAWPMPFYKLSVYQSNYFSIHFDGLFIKLDLTTVYPKNKKFVDQLMAAKAAASENQIT